MNYNPLDHYWIIGGDVAQVYSSARGQMVDAADKTYAAWLAGGGLPTRIASKRELGEVLADARVRPIDAELLDAFQDRHAETLTMEIVAKALFNLVNEIRTLKGQGTINAAQFRSYLKGLM